MYRIQMKSALIIIFLVLTIISVSVFADLVGNTTTDGGFASIGSGFRYAQRFQVGASDFIIDSIRSLCDTATTPNDSVKFAVYRDTTIAGSVQPGYRLWVSPSILPLEQNGQVWKGEAVSGSITLDPSQYIWIGIFDNASGSGIRQYSNNVGGQTHAQSAGDFPDPWPTVDSSLQNPFAIVLVGHSSSGASLQIGGYGHYPGSQQTVTSTSDVLKGHKP